MYISQYRYLLDGFSLNKNISFDAIIRHSFHPQLNKEDGSVTIELPALIPGVNLNLPWPQPVYRMVFSIGVIIAAGIEMGAQHTMSEIHFVKYCGNAKILLVG
jgi:hypothetical protein